MKLKDYRLKIGKTMLEAACENGVSRQVWLAWEKDPQDPKFKDPKAANKIKIFEWSSGHVTPNDFYDLPELPGAVLGASGDMPDRPADKAAGKEAQFDMAARSPGGAGTLHASALSIREGKVVSGSASSNGYALPGQFDMFAEGRS